MPTTATHYIAAAELLERLLTDTHFREVFRADPAGTCRRHGLELLATEFERLNDMLELEERESRSTLAGILLAAAVDGVGVADWLADLAGDTASALQAALTADPRALPAVQLP